MIVTVLAGGCATTPGNPDPWEKMNREVYKFNDNLDRWVLKPLADGYTKITPEPVRDGIGNAFTNLRGPDVILNDFLQGKGPQGLSDLGRFAVNTTVGVAGIFDPATKWGMPAHRENFGQTLAVWGVKEGPYVVLPLFGPATLRDSAGIPVSIVTHPLFWVDFPAVTTPLWVLDLISTRAEAEGIFRFRDISAVEPYVATREAYLQYRRNQIEGESTPVPDLDEPGTGTK